MLNRLFLLIHYNKQYDIDLYSWRWFYQ